MNEDSIDPQALYISIWDSVTQAEDNCIGYDRLPRTTLPLATLRSAYDRQDSVKAVAYLHHLSTLSFDEDDTVDVHSPKYCFSADKSFLDFFMVVGDRIGIEMFIPIRPSPTFSIELDLRLNIKDFRAKYGYLGFDPTGCMLCIGHSSVEDFWLGIAPHSFHSDTETFHLGESHGDTRLSGQHYRMIIAFFGCVLQKLRG